MSTLAPHQRPISRIADEIRHEWIKVPMSARKCLAQVDALERIIDQMTYQAVAALRREMHPWRSNAARRLKAELEVSLSHYRATQLD